MIDSVFIKGFKCFDEVDMELSGITLLTGVNSGGKSSFIQALLLLSQNVSYRKLSPLNGHLVSIGRFVEARNFVTNSKEFYIEITSGKNKLSYRFTGEGDDCVSEKLSCDDELVRIFDYNQRHIHYLCADRIGVKDIYNKNLDQADKYGVFGEYALDFLEKNKSIKLDERLIKDSSSLTLEAQLNYWLKYILNAEISTEDIIGTDRVKVEYSYQGLRKLRPSNIGSGISYIISALIIGLSAESGDLILLENPEIHLHPKAQAKLTEFFVCIANFGAQLIIESHSDHIYNGIRRNINKNTISPTDVAIYFFQTKGGLSEPTRIEINKCGQVINHQEGLFDQFDNDLDELLGL